MNFSNILITRPLNKSKSLSNLLKQLGFKIVCLPMIEIIQYPINIINQQLNKLVLPDSIIFISANACENLNNQLGEILKKNNIIVASIGNATTTKLNKNNINVDITPPHSNSEALLSMEYFQHCQNKNIWIIRGTTGRELLAQTLKKRGANTHYINVYRRQYPQYNIDELNDALTKQPIHLTLGTSNEIITNLVNVIKKVDASYLYDIPLLVASHRNKTHANSLGFSEVFVSASASNDDLTKSIDKILG
ncbi:MAG: uroporphyrinogen-III synthase [Methylococcales bacterium]|nr:uroporphyrinogen-III synthase [Methylococcales bacterium]